MRHFYHQSLLLNFYKWSGTTETCRTKVHKKKKLGSSFIHSTNISKEEDAKMSVYKVSGIHTSPYCTAEQDICHMIN